MSWTDWDATQHVRGTRQSVAGGAQPTSFASQACAVAFGSEGSGVTGVPAAALEGDAGCEWVFVPMASGVRSLNLAATAAVALATAARQLRVGPFAG